LSKSSRRSGRRVSDPGANPSGTTRPSAVPSTSPVGTPRAGRRDRTRSYARRSFFERFRTLIIGAVAVLVIGLVGAFVFLGATQPAYACTTEWVPDPTTAPAQGATPRLGYVQPDQGRLHGAQSGEVYTLCPPASGTHLNIQGRGPIRAGFYGSEDTSVAIPQGWLHNLEHGALVVLYRCDDASDACDDAGQERLRELNATFPVSPICGIQPGNVGPVIARFDSMAWPYAALVWGRVMPMETWDKDLILRFWQTEGERTNPERQPGCPFPGTSPSPAPSGSEAPSEAPSPSPS
jgi:hypothetical protein